MQEPEATQRNWLDGSQVVVAGEGRQEKRALFLLQQLIVSVMKAATLLSTYDTLVRHSCPHSRCRCHTSRCCWCSGHWSSDTGLADSCVLESKKYANMQTVNCRRLCVRISYDTRLPEAVRAYSHPSWCRCCCGAGSLGDTDTAALRWASLESGRRLGKRRCACGRAEADTAGCTAGRHKRYGLTRARTQFISFKPEEDWQHHHLPAWSSPLFFPL